MRSDSISMQRDTESVQKDTGTGRYTLSGVQVTQILKPLATQILRDHHPLSPCIRYTNIGATIE